MSGKYIFDLKSDDRRRALPNKIIIGQADTETPRHVLLKFLAYVLFFRERIQVEVMLHNDSIPFTPDIVQLDYELRPRLWVECGDCAVVKLDKLAVKVPDAEIWVLKRSIDELQSLQRQMAKAELRRNRYQLLAFDGDIIDELTGLMAPRNSLHWVSGGFDPPEMQFDFNGLWFDTPLTIVPF